MISNSIQAAIVVCGTLVVASEPVFAQTTTRESVNSSGEQANSHSYGGVLTADGSVVVFYSRASNLVPGDTNGVSDVFLRDRSTGVTERVSVDSSGSEANDESTFGAITPDGRYVGFGSRASNLVGPPGTSHVREVFIRDRVEGTIELVSVAPSGEQANDDCQMSSMSSDGRYVFFDSYATNLVDGDTNGKRDVFVHDRETGITERVSVDSSGAEGNDESFLGWGPMTSADGRFVVFRSYASNLVAGDTNGFEDIFVHDRSTGTTERVSVDSSGNQANNYSEGTTISADGMVVAFASWANNLVAGDTNYYYDVFVHDRTTGMTECVSVSPAGTPSTGSGPVISADGRYVAFDSDSTQLVEGDTNHLPDCFVRDRLTGITERVSVDSSGAQADDASAPYSITPDGRFVSFNSFATNLVDGDTNGDLDVFLRDRGQIDAVWSNYGAGFPGTNGVAPFTSLADPVIGTTVTLDLGNSSSEYTVGALFLGFERTTLHSTWGGDLLVVPVITHLVGLSPWGASILGDIPNDESLIGFSVDLQAIEVDPGAAKGFSFTQGLELVLGH